MTDYYLYLIISPAFYPRDGKQGDLVYQFILSDRGHVKKHDLGYLERSINKTYPP